MGHNFRYFLLMFQKKKKYLATELVMYRITEIWVLKFWKLKFYKAFLHFPPKLLSYLMIFQNGELVEHAKINTEGTLKNH